MSENMLHDTSILRLENITMQFGGVVAVDNLSMEVRPGEIVALIGPNGAGKTTAFNMITGVYEPTNGQISFEGSPVVRNHPRGKISKMYAGQNADLYKNKETLSPSVDRLTALGMARTFQNIRLFKSRTVFENVLIAKHLRRTRGFFSAVFRLNRDEEASWREESLSLLETTGLSAVKDENAVSLPYGLQRRLEIARALATRPRLLLLDEPAAGMNPQETDSLTAFIARIRREFGVSILLIEHHMNLVMDISDRIYVLDFGRMIATGEPREIQNNRRVIDAYLGVEEN